MSYLKILLRFCCFQTKSRVLFYNKVYTYTYKQFETDQPPISQLNPFNGSFNVRINNKTRSLEKREEKEEHEKSLALLKKFERQIIFSVIETQSINNNTLNNLLTNLTF